MNKIQSAQYGMCRVLQLFCEEHSSSWDSKPFFKTPYLELCDTLTEITSLLAIQYEDTRGITTHKNWVRDELVSLAVPVCNSLLLYAIRHEDYQMEEAINYTPYQLKRARETILVGIVHLILEHGEEHIADMEDFGLTASMLSDLRAKQQEFTGLIATPAEARVWKITATARMKQAFTRCHKLLRELDSAAFVIRRENPGFFNSYSLARQIDDPAHRTRALEIMVIDQDSDEAIPLVDIKVEDTRIRRRSRRTGQVRVQNLHPGKVTVICNKAGYEVETVSGYVTSGLRTKLIVRMRKISLNNET